MIRIAHIEGSKVVNVSLGETEFSVEYPLFTVVLPPDSPVGPGWDYIDGQFSDPRPAPLEIPDAIE